MNLLGLLRSSAINDLRHATNASEKDFASLSPGTASLNPFDPLIGRILFNSGEGGLIVGNWIALVLKIWFSKLNHRASSFYRNI